MTMTFDQQAQYFDEQQETAREAMEASLAASKAQVDGQYRVAKLQAKTAMQQMEVDVWYKRQSLSLLRKSASLERKKFGLDRQRLQWDQDKFRKEQKQQRQQFNQTMGLDILKQGVEYANKPADYVMASNWAQGIAGDPRFASAVNNLLTGQNARLFGAAGGAPQAANLGQLGNMYTGVASAGTTAADQLANGDNGAYDLAANAARAQSLVNTGSQLVQAGGQSLGAQSLESMDPITLGLTQAGVQGAGGDWESLTKQYFNAKPGQGNAQAA